MEETREYSNPQTKNDNFQRMKENINRLGKLADQTAVHRKKFEFALSQLRNFTQSYAKVADNTLLTPQEIIASNDFSNLLSELRQVMIKNLLQRWAMPTIENTSETVLVKVQEIFFQIRKIAIIMDSEASLEINPKSSEWIQYHILDLRAIRASFHQYKLLKDFDPTLALTIDKRLNSIDTFLSENSPENNFAPRTFSPLPVHYQSYRVSIDDFEEIKSIGGGVSANVFYGKDKRTGKEVAIKKFKFQKINGSKLQSFQREVAALATAIHPAVLRMIGATETMPFCIITDWMPNGSLYHDLHVHHRLDQTGKTICAFDIARGMQYLHKCQIVHRDLKSLNVLLDSNNKIRICDFGFSRHASDSSLMTQNIGTPHWMAPELLSTSTNYTSKIDVYAYGIVLWELATDNVPYSGMDSRQIIGQVLNNDIRPLLPPEVNPAMRDLITQCWDRDPNVRPTFDEIVKKFETEEVMMNDCNREMFLQYVKESATTAETKVKLVEEVIQQALSGQIELKSAVKKLEEVKIPIESIDVAWNVELIEKNKEKNPTDVACYCALFVKTSKLGEVAKILRSLKHKSVPQDVMGSFVEEIPTGSVEIDTDIVVAGCRNGVHDLVALYSTKMDDTILALNVCSHQGVDVTLKTAVVDRCAQSFALNNTELATAALRCILSIGELKRITSNVLFKFLSSADVSLCTCAYLAVELLAFEKRFPSDDLFDLILNEVERDTRAGVAVVACCKCSKILAEKFLAMMEEKPVVNEETLKALLAAVKNVDLRPRIKNILDSCKFEEKMPDLAEHVNNFKKLLL